MKFKHLILALFLIPAVFHPAIVNQIVVSVGSIAITSLDVNQMREFDKALSGKRPSASEALIKLINMTSLLVIAENNTEYYMDEIELRKNINNLTNNPADPTSTQRAELYNKYSYLYRLFLRSDKVRRGLMTGNAIIRNEVSTPVPEKEIKNFYNKNKAQMVDSPYPKLELIVFAVETSPDFSLDELIALENNMQELAKDLNTSSDFNALKRKYRKLKFTSYTGRTDLFTPDILILQKKIPDEIIGLSLQKSINLGTATLNIEQNKGIYVPQPIPIRATGKPTYVVVKVLQIQQPKQLSVDDARARIEEIIRLQRAEKAIDQMIKDRIKAGQITLTPIDTSYNGVFKSFNK